jgi:hypothetical protein
VRLNIDFSVFLPTSSVGVVSGTLEFQTLPRVGETISFVRPKPGVLPVRVPGFAFLLKVEDVLHTANPGGELVSLSLEDLTLEHMRDVDVLAQFLKDGFGLNFDRHDTGL